MSISYLFIYVETNEDALAPAEIVDKRTVLGDKKTQIRVAQTVIVLCKMEPTIFYRATRTM